jgi:hypothetical protein
MEINVKIVSKIIISQLAYPYNLNSHKSATKVDYLSSYLYAICKHLKLTICHLTCMLFANTKC